MQDYGTRFLEWVKMEDRRLGVKARLIGTRLAKANARERMLDRREADLDEREKALELRFRYKYNKPEQRTPEQRNSKRPRADGKCQECGGRGWPKGDPMSSCSVCLGHGTRRNRVG